MVASKLIYFKLERERLATEQKLDIKKSDLRILERGVQINLLDQIIDKNEMEMEVAK